MNAAKDEILKEIDEANYEVWNLRATPSDNYDPVSLVENALKKSYELNYRFGIAFGLLNKGMGEFIIKHNAEEANRLLDISAEIFKELENKKWISNTLLTKAILYTSSGKAETALYNALKGIEYYKEDKSDPKDTAMAFYVTGTVFKDLKKFEEAEKYYLTGMQITVNSSWTGRIYTSLSNIYSEKGEFDKALELALQSLEILGAENNDIGISRVLTDIGGIYKKLGQYDKALKYYYDGLKIREEKKMRHFVLGSFIEIAGAYEVMNETDKAIAYYLRSENLASEIGHLPRLSVSYEKLAWLNKNQGQLENSVHYYEKFIELTRELNKKERENKIDSLQNTLLQEKEQEIERLKNVELKNAYTLISEKNKEITDSIQYAKRIQWTLMASDEFLDKNLDDYFVLYKPKDIVSGDFYWATQPTTVNSPIFYLAVCDSTGHGVPGAFMSLLNITFLNEAINVKGISKPNEIFNYVREKLIHAVSQDGNRDGMDGILLCIDKETKTITYSAANNKPILKTKESLLNLSADKMPVGNDGQTSGFTLQHIKASKGDVLYLITDGFGDQFGGPRGKKFRHKNLEQTLNKISHLPMKEQADELDKLFEDWKGNLEQVDDVLIVGVKI